MNAPYNTGKVLIGSAYTPPRRVTMSRDEERLQTALLNSPRPPALARVKQLLEKIKKARTAAG